MKNFILKQLHLIAFAIIFANIVNAQWSRTAPNVYLTTSTDNVGIGLTAPTAKLDVSGALNVRGILSFGANSASGNNTLSSTGGSNGNIVYLKINGTGGLKTTATFGYDAGITFNAIGATPNFVVQTTGTTRMTILGNGNVGIGCTNPTVKLAVNGKIQATEVELKTTPCSDFVFEKSYKLMSLSDLEKYVTLNKHLPEVPSAKEFAANGYGIGQMDDVLLRKVEELTLYIIAQEKKLEEQQKEIQMLKTALKQ